MTYLKKSLVALGLFLFSFPMLPEAYGQGSVLYYSKVDTLKFGSRFNFRSNIIDWVTLSPNLGIEFTLGNKNWHKWTLGAFGRVNWRTNMKENTYHVYDIYDGRLELRKYWHGAGTRRVFYWGVYAGAGKFDIKISDIGRRGNSFFLGGMIGTTNELYSYKNGASLDLDLAVYAGAVMAKYDEYRRTLQGDKYIYNVTWPGTGYKLTFDPWIYAATTDIAHVSLVYHFGTKVSNRYKKREFIDDEYRLKLANDQYRADTLKAADQERQKLLRIKKAREKKLAEYAKADKEAAEAAEAELKKLREDTLRAEKLERKEQRALEKAKRKEQKELEKKQKAEAKAAQKAAAEDEKENSQQVTDDNGKISKEERKKQRELEKARKKEQKELEKAQKAAKKSGGTVNETPSDVKTDKAELKRQRELEKARKKEQKELEKAQKAAQKAAGNINSNKKDESEALKKAEKEERQRQRELEKARLKEQKELEKKQKAEAKAAEKAARKAEADEKKKREK